MAALLAFHGDPAIKALYLARVRAHRAADEIIHGDYWVERAGGFKGCAVGCTIHGNSHAAYEDKLGIPRAIAYLEDNLFESMTAPRDTQWPEQFLTAIPVGADLSMVSARFVLWLLVEAEPLAAKWEDRRPDTGAALRQVRSLYERRIEGDEPAATEWEQAAALADLAALAALTDLAALAARADLAALAALTDL
ncbi:MAG TPA: hypothetical protein VIN56_10195, partial [Candidatus Dormibacteraeota bacterium]